MARPTRRTPTSLREPVYMVDFAVFKPEDELRINLNECADSCWKWRHPDGEVRRGPCPLPARRPVICGRCAALQVPRGSTWT
jgi:hypothetical protein